MFLAQVKGLEMFGVSLVDLGWGLLIAGLIGAVGGIVYALLTAPSSEHDVRGQDDESTD